MTPLAIDISALGPALLEEPTTVSRAAELLAVLDVFGPLLPLVQAAHFTRCRKVRLAFTRTRPTAPFRSLRHQSCLGRT